jgi:hypothetical protein
MAYAAASNPATREGSNPFSPTLLAHPDDKAVLRILVRPPLREEPGRYAGGRKGPRHDPP